ncbi:MAG: hypothetical protein V4629_09655 [Pseudomonadota bacterium]
MSFPEIKPQDFMTFSRETPGYVQVEKALIEIGGKGVEGTAFKLEALTAAGWKYGKLISYGAHPQSAAEAFNLVRAVLETTKERGEIIPQIKQIASGNNH